MALRMKDNSDLSSGSSSGKTASLASQPRGATPVLDSPEDRFRLLVQSVKDYGIFMLDPNGYILNWNIGAERIKGYRADEILGKHFSAFYTPEDIARDHPRNELKLAIQNGRYEEEGWRIRKNG